jgi:hypothetical protein
MGGVDMFAFYCFVEDAAAAIHQTKVIERYYKNVEPSGVEQSEEVDISPVTLNDKHRPIVEEYRNRNPTILRLASACIYKRLNEACIDSITITMDKFPASGTDGWCRARINFFSHNQLDAIQRHAQKKRIMVIRDYVVDHDSFLL